jgi:two-component system, NtrC family, response regulator HydG
MTKCPGGGIISGPAVVERVLPRTIESVVTASILCIDDEPAVGVILEHILTRAGHRPVLVSSVEEAMRVVARSPIDLIIADYRMLGLTGLDLLLQLEREGYRIPVIIMTGDSSIEYAVMSVKSGPIGYLTKPIQAEMLEIAVRQALEVVRLRRQNETFRREIATIRGRRVLMGDSDAFRRIMEVVGTVAASRATVLLQGESGTGKGLFARAIHDQSPCADEAFITVDCAALPEGLVESALFGPGKGAFIDATVRSAGAFERAHGGTLLLDEISEMRLDLQAKLLRVIQEQESERFGGQQPIHVDVRIIATTNRDLKAEVDAGRFRGDLYDRLSVLPIRAPTLRERMEDIPLLVRHFVLRAAELQGGPSPPVAPETLEVLQRYPWPGNVRELANAVERAVILCRGSVLQPSDLDPRIRDAAAHPPRPAIVPDLAPPGAETVDYSLDAIERLAIERALAATGGNRTRAARLLGISERTLRNKLNTPRSASSG